jgi:Fe-S cluster biogenesis protein NfuA
MDPAAVERRVEEVSRLLWSHAGGIELDGLEADGQVRVRFTGMCTGCPFRPVTLATTIRPALAEVDAVREVEAAGVRVSEHAARRLAELSTAWWTGLGSRRRPDIAPEEPTAEPARPPR